MRVQRLKKAYVLMLGMLTYQRSAATCKRINFTCFELRRLHNLRCKSTKELNIVCIFLWLSFEMGAVLVYSLAFFICSAHHVFKVILKLILKWMFLRLITFKTRYAFCHLSYWSIRKYINIKTKPFWYNY